MMTLRYSAPCKGRTRFGIFTETNDDVSYFHIHFFSAAIELYWRMKR
jgi:hypothetical protein